VSVCIDRPILSLDRPFTYGLDAALEAGVGSLVQVSFHGRAVRGWVLGPTDDLPQRMLPIKKAVGPVRWFDRDGLALATWVRERYVAPLAAVLGRATPPRVASEEAKDPAIPGTPGPGSTTSALSSYRGVDALSRSITSPAFDAFTLRPAPEDEDLVVVEAVHACLRAGRRALVIVPEAKPIPGVARALEAAFGARCATVLGGSKRGRYRTWLDAQAGAFDVVVGSRPSVFAPVPHLGLIVISRESHPALREDRAPYYHTRDVALARGRIAGATVVLSSMSPSTETAALGLAAVTPTGRRWPPVEIVKPGFEGRAPRLVRALGEAKRAFLFSPLPGYGIAAVCRSCGQPAACVACGGLLRAEEGRVRCVVCEAEGRCKHCGAQDFGLRRGGRERVEEWAIRAASVPVKRLGPDDVPRLPKQGEILVGGPDDVRDFGRGGLDLVAILDADLAERRPGLTARERAVTTWMEAIAWARPDGRAIVQSSHASDPAVQALVRGNPDRFHADETRRRAEAGFPVGSAVFRIAGSAELDGALAAFAPTTMLSSTVEDQTVCLLALDPARVPAFGRTVRELAAREVITRVEAEPHL
jgi:primosomal protein N' (replication factor Y) (superfamily II helicase)